MSFIFISFADNLDKESKSKRDFYNTSLEKQYENLKKRIPINRRIDEFETFIEHCFPSGITKKYFLSCPNFLREKRENKNGVSFLNNLVIRPEKTLSMNSYLPDNQNIILIGDIHEGDRLKMFSVKGIQLIDDSLSSPYDMVIKDCAVCNSFSRANWNVSNVDYDETFFNPDNVLEIVKNCYTVEKPKDIFNTYELWSRYFDFREYYLEEQSKRNLELSSCVYLNSYAVNKKEYKNDSRIYDDNILDNHDDFKRGDMIFLSKKVSQAESFPLIRIDIIRNKKKFNSSIVFKNGKSINEEEKSIRSLASENVIITQIDPNEEDILGKMINSGYELGDRIKTIKFEILPKSHIDEITDKFFHEVEDFNNTIEKLYRDKVVKEVNEFLNNFENERKREIEAEVLNYSEELNNQLYEDIEKNEDTEIIKLIDIEKKRIKNENKQNKNESNDDYKIRIEELYRSIDVESYYYERNNKLVLKKEKELIDKLKTDKDSLKISKEREFTNKYSENVRTEIAIRKEQLESNLETDKKKIIDEETEICFSIYFKPNEKKEIDKKQIEIINDCEYIVYDYRAESAKLKRQKIALDNFYSGNVKNPYLSTYLFTPEKLQPVISTYDNWQWYLESLNDKQKEAVRKAVSSNGIFLLQGPPGTGKTQVIAETVAHLVKAGKKVLISSETHKAIDNVFDRLPKIAEIVPIRLIPSKNSKESEYTPKFLVDNFYNNISTNLNNIVEKYKNFKKNKEDFNEKYNNLLILNVKIEKNKKALLEAQNKIKDFEEEIRQYNKKISELNDIRDSYRNTIDTLNRTKRFIEKYKFVLDDSVKTEFIAKFMDKLSNSFESNEFNTQNIENLVSLINKVKISEIEEEVSRLDSESNTLIIKARMDLLRLEMSKLRDELGDTLPGKEEELKVLRTEFIDLKKKLENDDQSSSSDSILTNIFSYDYMISNKDLLCTIIESKKNTIESIKNEIINEVDDELNKVQKNIEDNQTKINDIVSKINELNSKIYDIQEDEDIKDLSSSQRKLEEQIDTFFKEFSILEPYQNINDALTIIKKTYDDLEKNYNQREAENKEKIPMYEKISKYLLQTDVIEDDRKKYTKELFESANVFGITCTSNDRFSNENNDEFGQFNLENIDIKNVGIDVVIIDEVSKSSFIDLLIPILYGKTVILVGDHRQLPPMYDLAKMRDEEFESLDERIINPDINKKYTKLYEECFFKTLFEKIPNDYKIMLVQQYRCHEHIMKVFNHFYQGELRLGFNGQNNEKKHNIELIANQRRIVQPDKHIYFIDCKTNETRDSDSTSIYNAGEAKIVVEILLKLKEHFKNNPQLKPLSVGVICTYGDQAKKIKEYMKNAKITNNDFYIKNEKLIVSTVDDFQGDERDIIILSTVRNPLDAAKSNPGFILAYQRINVALSRARRLLFITGNREYLEQRGVIDLPDIYGRADRLRRNFRVYEEIISTIETYGKIIEDTEVIDVKETKINA